MVHVQRMFIILKACSKPSLQGCHLGFMVANQHCRISLSFIARYDKLTKPSWVPGSSFGLIAAGYTITGMLDGIAIYAGLQVSRYELFKSISTSAVFLIYKTLYLIWPAILFHFNNLIMVSVTMLTYTTPSLDHLQYRNLKYFLIPE